ncbi:poly-beta-1,6-N-acetyl-D-glucosamine synthase [archaeon BMS3Abin17]|nr:poly-beta-1,6-N-acetyl-D-glucosamine synthase [archaeon BMS3Abin17]HDZ61228.1 glycosyltransferase family 2 protein [Candidatus Pacearchaeota archaeon]
MKYPKVSILIINYNGGDKVIRCLNSVMKLDYPSYEIIVIDNGSSDGSQEKIKKEFSQIKLVENKENLGSVGAHNQGFKLAKGDFILGLDDDAVASPSLLKNLVKVALSNNKIGIVVPKIYYYSKPNIFNSTGFFLNPITGKMKDLGIGKEDKGQLDFQREIDYVPSSIILIKKEALKTAGGMNEDYFVYYEDSDWCLRVRNAGYKIVYTPNTKAWHDCKTQGELSPFRVYHYTRGKTLFMKQSSTPLNKFLFILFHIFLYSPARIFSFILKGKFNLIKPYIQGTKEGLSSKRK